MKKRFVKEEDNFDYLLELKGIIKRLMINSTWVCNVYKTNLGE